MSETSSEQELSADNLVAENQLLSDVLGLYKQDCTAVLRELTDLTTKLNNATNQSRNSARLARGQSPVQSSTIKNMSEEVLVPIQCVMERLNKLLVDSQRTDVFTKVSVPGEEKNPCIDEDDERVASLIRIAIENRDAYWRERLKDTSESQLKMTEKFSGLLDTELNKVEAFRKEREHLRTLEQEERIAKMTEQIQSLTTEVEGGKKIIQQFSQLMKDKASAICQYCRRSGTLPPIPTR